MAFYQEARTITARGDDGHIYTILEADRFAENFTTGDLTCDAGPVIRLSRGVYEIWVSDSYNPRKVTAISTTLDAP